MLLSSLGYGQPGVFGLVWAEIVAQFVLYQTGQLGNLRIIVEKGNIISVIKDGVLLCENIEQKLLFKLTYLCEVYFSSN